MASISIQEIYANITAVEAKTLLPTEYCSLLEKLLGEYSKIDKLKKASEKFLRTLLKNRGFSYEERYGTKNHHSLTPREKRDTISIQEIHQFFIDNRKCTLDDCIAALNLQCTKNDLSNFLHQLPRLKTHKKEDLLLYFEELIRTASIYIDYYLLYNIKNHGIKIPKKINTYKNRNVFNKIDSISIKQLHQFLMDHSHYNLQECIEELKLNCTLADLGIFLRSLLGNN
jgi:hypothetical protein